MAEAPDSITLVEPERGLGEFQPADAEKVALVAQTTLGLYEWQQVMDDASARFPDLKTARKSDLCYATTNRQEAVNQLSAECDLILVVGSHNSSNTQALVRVSPSRTASPPTGSTQPTTSAPSGWKECEAVGVTAGASAPDHLVQEVIDRLAPARGFELWSVDRGGGVLPAPAQLRAFVTTLQTLVEAGVTASKPGRANRSWSVTANGRRPKPST